MIDYFKPKKKLKLVVQIPAYNEEKTITKVIKEIPKRILGISDVKVLVIDDGSKDRTVEMAQDAGADHILQHKINRGLGKSFRDGIEKSLSLDADIIVNIDGDGQFNSKDVPRLIQPILDNQADMVTVSRFLDPKLTKNMPWIKKWGNRRFTSLISKITGQKFTDTQCGFRAYSKEAALRLNLKGKFTYTQEVFIDLAEKGMRINEIPSEVTYHQKRQSIISGNLKRYGFKSLAIIARATRDTKPLTFFGMPAVITFVLGFLGGLVSFFYWLFEHVTTPVRTLLSISTFMMIFGASLMIMALIADMLITLKQNQEEILYRLKKRELNE